MSLLLVQPTPVAADPSPQLTLEERARLVALLQSSQAETLELLADLAPEHWHTRTAEDRWSIGEIVEHLVRAEATIRASVEALSDAEPDPDWQTRKAPSVDDLVAVGSDRSQKFEAPEPIRPTGKMTHEQGLKLLLEQRSDSIDFVLETTQPLRAVARPAPIGQPLDGHGWLALIGAHNIRHNKQIAEVKSALEKLK